MAGKYLIGDRAPIKVGRKVVPIASPHQITADTQLVSVEECSRLLMETKGWSLSPTSIRKYCTKGQWRSKQGTIWVKPGKQYLLNMAAIYEAIASGDA